MQPRHIFSLEWKVILLVPLQCGPWRGGGRGGTWMWSYPLTAIYVSGVLICSYHVLTTLKKTGNHTFMVSFTSVFPSTLCIWWFSISQDVLKKELWGCLIGFWGSWSYFFLETFGLLVALMFVLMNTCWNNCRVRSHQVEPQVQQLHPQAR